MKKSHKFDELSNVTCTKPNCDRRIKKRFVERGDTERLCYKCFKVELRAKQNTQQFG